MTLIANALFIIYILFWLWFVIVSIIYRHKESTPTGHQSERQKKNEDYNMDYHP